MCVSACRVFSERKRRIAAFRPMEEFASRLLSKNQDCISLTLEGFIFRFLVRLRQKKYKKNQAWQKAHWEPPCRDWVAAPTKYWRGRSIASRLVPDPLLCGRSYVRQLKNTRLGISIGLNSYRYRSSHSRHDDDSNKIVAKVWLQQEL